MIVLKVDGAQSWEEFSGSMQQIKLMVLRFPGEHDLRIEADAGSLTLGPEHRYDGSQEFLSQLGEFGEPVIVHD